MEKFDLAPLADKSLDEIVSELELLCSSEKNHHKKKWVSLNSNTFKRIIHFKQRNNQIKLLGFESYKDYLASALWKSIRARVVERDKCCTICSSSSNLQAHHTSYTKKNLRGKNIHNIITVCNICHKGITTLEWEKQLTPEKATRIYLDRSRKQVFPTLK